MPALVARLTGLIALGGAGLLLLGAIVPEARLAVAGLVVLGWLVLSIGRDPAGIGWAAAVPLTIALTWPWVLGVDAPVGPVACAAPLSAVALRRLTVALVVIALVLVLARVHRLGAADLGLRRPRGWELVLALGGVVGLAVGGLVIGPWIAEPFFGRVEFERPVGALLPALLFGISNGVLEELAYRGALQGWLGRVAQPSVGIVVQALVFGIVHAGEEVTGLLPVHVALLAASGLIAGLWVRRTGSLAVPMGIHIGADIALYFGLACRAAA